MSLRIFTLFFLSFLFSIAGICDEVEAVDRLKTLDQALAPAKNLSEFLNSKAIQETYFKALNLYYGTDIPKSTYLELLFQMRKLSSKIPGFSERLWETDGLGTAFEIQTALRTSGRSLDAKKWNAYLKELKDTLKLGAEEIGQLNNDEAVAQYQTYLSNYQTELAQVEANLEGLSKSEKELRRADFYKLARKSVEAKKWADYFLSKHLATEAVTDQLGSGDADVILEYLDEFRNQTKSVLILPKLFEPFGSDQLPSPIITLMRERILDKSQLLAKEDLFPILMKKARDGKFVPVGSGGLKKYSFYPIPRRIHGVWKGIPLGECVGGGDEAALTPERWATVALKDTQLYYVEQGDSYLGFIQMVPLQYEKNIYGSVDFGAGVMARKTMIELANKKFVAVPMFDLWYTKQSSLLPKKWKGLVVSESSAIDNAGALDTVRSSTKYVLGQVIGPTKEFKRTDPMGTQIIKFSPKGGDYSAYSGRMIFDGVMEDSGKLRKLINADAHFFQNERKILALLKNGNAEFKLRVIPHLKNTNSIPIQLELIKLSKNRLAEVKNAAYKLLIRHTGINPEIIAYQLQVLEKINLSEKNESELESFIALMTTKKAYSAAAIDHSIEFFEKAKSTSQLGWKVSKYLAATKLSSNQLSRLRTIAASREGASYIVYKTLLKVDPNNKEMKIVFEEQVKRTIQDPSDRIDFAQHYLERFGWTKRTEELALSAAGFEINRKESWAKVREALELISKVKWNKTEAKALALQALKKNKNHGLADIMEVLLNVGVTQTEIEEWIVSDRLWHETAALKEMLKRIERPSLHFAEVIFRTALVACGNSGGSAEILIEFMSGFSPEENAKVLELARQAFDTKEKMGLGDRRATDKYHEMERVFEILANETLPLSVEFQTKILDYLYEKFPRSDRAHVSAPNAMLARFDLRNPLIGPRVLALWTQKRLDVDQYSTEAWAKSDWHHKQFEAMMFRDAKSLAKYNERPEWLERLNEVQRIKNADGESSELESSCDEDLKGLAG